MPLMGSPEGLAEPRFNPFVFAQAAHGRQSTPVEDTVIELAGLNVAGSKLLSRLLLSDGCAK